ncbi:MAG TPA: outer membrane beta-barrel protein, partial [Chitinophagales bacterium]|nr:outer membrane beta-barrel protein [Chitinophagales bacterium]
DGNSQKAMNILTKKGMSKGVFGKVYAGYGYLTDSRYSAGASVNYFDGDRRIALIGMSNNVNSQNFDMQDLLGVTGSSGGGRMRGGMGGNRPRGGGGGGNWGNNPASNFMVGQQGGISTTHSAGLNYSDVLGKKNNLKLTGSYFFNYSKNVNQTDLTRQYFNAGDSSTYYKESNTSNSVNMNHRVNLRMEYLIDSMNNLIFTPKFSYQQNEQTNTIDGTNTIAQTEFLSRTLSTYKSKSAGYNVSGDLLYQHKFRKLYRTLSVGVGTTINNKDGNSSQMAVNSFAEQSDSAEVDQQATTIGTSYKVNGNITYTEPAGKSGMVQLSYEPTYTWNKSDKQTLNLDTNGSGEYNLLDTVLSNKYDNEYMTQKASASYRLKGTAFNFNIGVSGQYALLTGESVFPLAYQTSRTFYSVLPNLMFNYKFKNSSNLRIMYRTSTNPPTISQLQSVVDNTNPLLLSTGNPELKQSYSHFMMVRYGLTNPKTAHSFFAFASANYTSNYVGNSTFIATSDTLINGLVTLNAGSQLTRPVNIEGQLNVNSFLTYGLPVKKIKSNMNFNAGFTYLRTPSLINNAQNLASTYGVNGGITLSSNINEKIDFTINYMGTYNIVQNSLQTASNNNYYQHSAGARFNWQFWKGFVFNTNLQNTLYAGIAQGFNQNIFLWNAALGYKFLKDQNLDVRLSVNDILNQNTGIARNVTETYIEDTKTNVLKRYLMLTVTYTIKYNKKKG